MSFSKSVPYVAEKVFKGDMNGGDIKDTIQSNFNYIANNALNSANDGIEFLTSSFFDTTTIMSMFVGYFIGLLILNICICFWKPQRAIYKDDASGSEASPVTESFKGTYFVFSTLVKIFMQLFLVVPVFYFLGKSFKYYRDESNNNESYYLIKRLILISLGGLFISWLLRLFTKYNYGDFVYCARTENIINDKWDDLSQEDKLLLKRTLVVPAQSSGHLSSLFDYTKVTEGMCLRTKFQGIRDATLIAGRDFALSIIPDVSSYFTFLYAAALAAGAYKAV